MFEGQDSVFMAMRAGARGYVLKDTDEEKLLRAIRVVGSGEAIFSLVIAAQLMQFFGKSQSTAKSLYTLDHWYNPSVGYWLYCDQ
jgi:DNA-binding NarL/FixJ family response regulator